MQDLSDSESMQHSLKDNNKALQKEVDLLEEINTK